MGPPSAHMPPSKASCPDDDEQLRAFRACPVLKPEPFEAWLPDVMWAAHMLADTLAVCWEWGLLALLTVASGLVPEDRFEPAPSISIPSSLWVVLLHPGATNSSGVVQAIATSVATMFDWLYAYENNRDLAAQREEAPRRQLLAGGGSLAATGLQMSLQQNRGAALSVEPEIEQVLSWFTAESSIDRAAPAKLWDGSDWHRPVMDKTRAFTVHKPWFGCCSGGHIPEMHKATLQDVFGLRQRVTAVYGAPKWSTIAEVRSACAKLPTQSHKPAQFMAGLCYPLLRWAVGRDGMTFIPCPGDGAQALVDENFDEHMAMQQDAFLQPGRHEEAKYHGKLRTKFNRMALALHVLQAVCAAWRSTQDATDIADTWGLNFQADAQIPKDVFQFAYAFCDHAEAVWRLLDFARTGHALPSDPSAQDIQSSQLPLAPPEKTYDFESLMTAMRGSQHGPGNDDLDAITELGAALPGILLRFVQRLPLHGFTLAILLKFMEAVLSVGVGSWFYWNQSDAAKRKLAKIWKEHTHFGVFLACLMLQSLGLGQWCRSIKTAGGGRGIWFFEKRKVSAQMRPILVCLGLTADSVPSLDSYTESVQRPTSRPPRAPAVTVWKVSPSTEVLQSLSAALGLHFAVGEAAAPAAAVLLRDDGFGAAPPPPLHEDLIADLPQAEIPDVASTDEDPPSAPGDIFNDPLTPER